MYLSNNILMFTCLIFIIFSAMGSYVVPVLQRIHGSLAAPGSQPRSGSSSQQRRTPSTTTPSPGPLPLAPSSVARELSSLILIC